MYLWEPNNYINTNINISTKIFYTIFSYNKCTLVCFLNYKSKSKSLFTAKTVNYVLPNYMLPYNYNDKPQNKLIRYNKCILVYSLNYKSKSKSLFVIKTSNGVLLNNMLSYNYNDKLKNKSMRYNKCILVYSLNYKSKSKSLFTKSLFTSKL